MVDEVIMVSTRVGWGGASSATATSIPASAYSLVEPNVSTSGTNQRFWKYDAVQDGAIRVDAMLSMPGSMQAAFNTWIELYVYLLNDDDTITPLSIHRDDGVSLSFIHTSAIPDQYQSGSILVEAGETYIIMLWPRQSFGSAEVWGPVLRVSSVRPAETTWYQPDDRTVTDWTGDTGYTWTDPLNPWDEFLGGRNHAGGDTIGYATGGKFKWEQSLGGLNPVTKLGSELGIFIPWDRARSGNEATLYAAPDFNGALSGPPPIPPSGPVHWGTGQLGVFNRWNYRTFDIGPFTFLSSEFEANGLFVAWSLTWERWKAGPTVGYTQAELLAFAGITGAQANQVVGLLYEDDLPEILSVSVTADWNQVAIENACPVQWWVGPSRLLSDFVVDVGEDVPIPVINWGPAYFVRNAVGADPVFQYVDFAGVLEGGDAKPHDFIQSDGMTLIGTYSSGNPVYEVPEETWRAALDVEELWVETDTSGVEDDPDSFYPLGLTFLAGTAEFLTSESAGPGLATPGVNSSTAKGLERVWVWPKIEYRPTRFKVIFAPPLEIPLLSPTGGPALTRQHFEPIPPG